MKKNPLETAKEKGAWAARIGLKESDCPYRDKRKSDNRLTFSRAWRNAWIEGFRSWKAKTEPAPLELDGG